MDSNKRVIERFADEVWRRRNLAAITELFHEDYADPEIAPPCRDGLAAFFRRYFELRPDFRLEAHELIGEGERVVQIIEGAFTNQEPRRGAVGAAMRTSEINVFWLRDGRIARHFGIGRSWESADSVEADPDTGRRAASVAVAPARTF